MKQQNYKLLVIVAVIILFVQDVCYADIIYLMNGQTIEGIAERTSEGVWVEGLLFAHNEIKHIEEKPFERKVSNGKPWYQDIINFFGFKTDKQKQIEALDERINKNSKLLKEMDEMYEAERIAAKEAMLNTATKIMVAEQEEKAKERERKKQSDFMKKAKNPKRVNFENIDSSSNQSYREDCKYNSSTQMYECKMVPTMNRR